MREILLKQWPSCLRGAKRKKLIKKQIYWRHHRNWILTVCAFIFPVIKANKSASDIKMVQSAFLAARQRDQENFKCICRDLKTKETINVSHGSYRKVTQSPVCLLVSLWTQPLPFFTSTNHVASFPFGPSLTLKAKTPPIFFTNCSPSCSVQRF